MIHQIGNITPKNNQRWNNPQRNRVYLTDGECPTVCDYSGGGGLVPLLVIEDDLGRDTTTSKSS